MVLLSEAISNRPNWNQYFMDAVHQKASRATCLRGQVGAVIVKNQHEIATGYNGAPRGLPHCLDVGCLLHESILPDGSKDVNCTRIVHAEANAISQAARFGTSIDGAEMYVTHSPCIHCIKLIVNAGIWRVFYRKPYRLDLTREIVQYCRGFELVEL